MTQIRVQCPNCGKQYSAPATRAGQSLNCLHCGTPIQIPGGRASPLLQPAAKGDNSRFVLTIAAAVGGGVLLLLIVVLVISSLGGGGGDSQGPPVAAAGDDPLPGTAARTANKRQWQRFEDREGRFAVEIPGEPNMDTKAESNARLDLVSLLGKLSAREYFDVDYAKFHKLETLPEPKERVTQKSESFLKLHNGPYTIEHEQWGSHDDKQYFDQIVHLTGSRERRTTNVTHHMRTYYGHDWLMTLSWMVATPDKPDPAEVQRFFESFEVLK